MDGVTLAINSFNNEIITALALLFDNEIIYAIILFGLVFLLEKQDYKRKKLIVAIFLAFFLGLAIKEVIATERPCYELMLKTKCEGYSFPSIHAITAFTFALAFIDEKKYIWVLLFAVFVSLSRIYLGVHTFFDICASMAFAPIVYGFVDYYWRKNK